MLKKILMGWGILLLAFVAVVALQPADYMVKSHLECPEPAWPFVIGLKT